MVDTETFSLKSTKYQKKKKLQISHSFDFLVLLTSIPSEISVLPKCRIFILFIIYIDNHLRKLVYSSCLFHAKQL